MSIIMSTPYRAMTAGHSQHMTLRAMDMSVQLQDTCALVQQTQRWQNSERVNIEAIYSFPLPAKASLLDVSVTLNDRLIVAKVVEARQAERRYEEAMVEGDTAMLLEQVESGLYNLNLGNLLPGDSASICIRYALPLQWEGRQLRLALPTAVAPRYGSPAGAGLQPQQIPQADIGVEHGYRLNMTVSGKLAQCAIQSPSHRISLSPGQDQTRVGFADGSAAADRDLVIILTSAEQPAASAQLASVGHTHLLHAAFPIPAEGQSHPLNLKVLVDCSGSMGGDSIQLARGAALRALQQLSPGDQYALCAFGSSVVHGPGNEQQTLTVTEQGIDLRSLRFARHLDADLGGTEMRPALRAVFGLESQAGEDSSADVLLITDGETWDRDEIVRLCRESRHRVFVIGCGACPAESVVREIAEATGGAAVFVGPHEDVGAVVDRHLQRMRQPRISAASLSLTGQLWQAPTDLSRCTFADSTLHVFAQLPSPVSELLQLHITYRDGRSLTLCSEVAPCPPALAEDAVRMGIDNYIRETLFSTDNPDREALTRLAVEHQVISPFTHYLMVEPRGGDAATTDPELRRVPGMLAAGWGGTGIARAPARVASPDYDAMPDFGATTQHVETLDYLEMPTFMRRAVDDSGTFTPPVEYSTAAGNTPAELIGHLNDDFSLLRPNRKPRLSLIELRELMSCTSQLTRFLHELVDGVDNAGWSEREVLLAFWQALLEHPALGALFSRSHQRAIMRTLRQEAPPAELLEIMTQGLGDCTADQWDWAAIETTALDKRFL